MRGLRGLVLVCLAAIAVALPGVSGAVPGETAKSPGAAKAAPLGPAVKPTVPSLTGKVLEVIDASPYTYLRLKTAQGETWAAVNKTPIKKGSEVTIADPLPMDGFESKSLKRKFDHIVFGTLAGANPAGPSARTGGGVPAATGPQDVSTFHSNVSGGAADAGKIKVKKAEGANAKTVEEIFSGRSSLKDKPVNVRGKVVKFNPAIMGKNWVHLRDGSGSAEKKNNDITITTQDSVAVGDVVTVSGPVRLDRDFGSGYRYAVIIEDAKVSK